MERKQTLVTLYYPNAQTVENIRAMAMQSDRIYLCDNSPEPHEALFADIPGAVYRFFGKNLGLSQAFNTIFRDYEKDFQEEDFILFFDQDSTPPEGHVQRLVDRFKQLEQAGFPVGCLGPVYNNPYTGQLKLPRVRRTVEENVYAVESIITSSMLSRYRVLRDVRFWNENVFLDMADWDICWRIREQKFLCCAARDIVLEHRLGGDVKNQGKDAVRRSRMVREYYQAREALYLLRQPYTPFRFRLKFINNLTFKYIYRLLTFSDRESRRMYYRQARLDYQRGYCGEYNAANQHK